MSLAEAGSALAAWSADPLSVTKLQVDFGLTLGPVQVIQEVA